MVKSWLRKLLVFAAQQPSSERSLMTEHTLELRSGPRARAVHAFDIVSSRTLKAARPAQAAENTVALENLTWHFSAAACCVTFDMLHCFWPAAYSPTKAQQPCTDITARSCRC